MSNQNLVKNLANEGKQEAKKIAYNPLMEVLARMGFAARGLLYFVMGLISLQVARGAAGAPADQQGALSAIATLPVGRILLIIMVVGLVGYSLWGLIRGLFDPLQLGRDSSAIIQRLGYLVSAISYFSLVMPVVGLLSNSAPAARNGAQTAQIQQSTSSLLTTSIGHLFLLLVGCTIIVVGLLQIYTGINRKFDKQFKMYKLDKDQSRIVKQIGRVGFVARGVVFAMMGILLFIATLQSNAGKAVGYDGALMALVRLPFGPWLLAVEALGLMAFGLYSMAGAAWFRLSRNK